MWGRDFKGTREARTSVVPLKTKLKNVTALPVIPKIPSVKPPRKTRSSRKTRSGRSKPFLSRRSPLLRPEQAFKVAGPALDRLKNR